MYTTFKFITVRIVIDFFKVWRHKTGNSRTSFDTSSTAYIGGINQIKSLFLYIIMLVNFPLKVKLARFAKFTKRYSIIVVFQSILINLWETSCISLAYLNFRWLPVFEVFFVFFRCRLIHLKNTKVDYIFH